MENENLKENKFLVTESGFITQTFADDFFRDFEQDEDALISETKVDMIFLEVYVQQYLS